MQNIHGVQVTEVANASPPPIPLPNISAVGVIGTAPDTVLETLNIAGGRLTFIDVTNRGRGYTAPPTVTITGGGASTDATAVAVVVGGKVVRIEIDTPGDGYTAEPDIAITPHSTDTTGQGATARAATPGRFTVLVDGKREIGWNTPFLLNRAADAVQFGDRGTLPTAIENIYAQQGAARVVVVPIESFQDGAAIAAFTRATWVAPGTDAPGSVNASTQVSLYIGAEKTGVLRVGALTTGTPSQTDLLGLKVGQIITINTTTPGTYKVNGTPTLDTNASPKYVDIPIRETQAASPAPAPANTLTVAAQDGAALTNTAALGDSDERDGVYALLSAESVTGVRPRILTAAGLDTATRVSGNKNALGAALETVATQLRSVAYIDAPPKVAGQTAHAHKQAILLAAKDFGSDRVYFLAPRLIGNRDGQNIPMAASAYAAGVTLRVDANSGFWTIPSNKLINNALGTEIPIDFEMGSPASTAQNFNDAGIATVVNIDGGFRLWGDFTRATGERVTWKFLSVRRIADALYDAIANNHLWAVDKNITLNYLDSVSQGVNNLLRDMRSLGAILGGTCYPDPALNSERNLSLGIVSFTVEFTPVYPARTVNFKIELNTTRLAELANQLSTAA